MSRSRSTSTISRKDAESLQADIRIQDPILIKMLRLSRPQLQFGQDSDEASLPAFYSSNLVIPKGEKRIYVGENFKSIIAIQKVGDIDGDIVHSRIDIQNPDRIRSELNSLSYEFSTQLYHTYLASIELTHAGVWNVIISLRYEQNLTAQALRRNFQIEAKPAILVRTKISQASSDDSRSSQHSGQRYTHILEAQIENITDTAMVLESCELIVLNKWQVFSPPGTETPHLKPREVYQWCFMLVKGEGSDAAKLSIGWRREPLGVKGWQTTGIIKI